MSRTGYALAKGGRGLEIYWRNAVATTPHRLRVHPGLYIPQLNTGVPYAEVAQDVRHRAFVSLAQLSLLSAWRLGGISVNPTLFLRAQHQALDTGLGVTSHLGTYHPLSSREMHNGISFTRLGAGLGHELTYKSETFNLYAVLPLFYYHTLMQDEFRPQDRLSEGRLYFEPNGWLSYHVTPDFSIKLYGSMSRTEPTLSSLYAGYIMRSYRSLVRNEMRQFSSLTTRTSLNLEYKDIFSMLFVGCGLSYSHYPIRDRAIRPTLASARALTGFPSRSLEMQPSGRARVRAISRTSSSATRVSRPVRVLGAVSSRLTGSPWSTMSPGGYTVVAAKGQLGLPRYRTSVTSSSRT